MTDTLRSDPTDRRALAEASQLLELDVAGARLVSNSSRAVWQVPKEDSALFITRPNMRSFADVLGEKYAVRAAVAAGVRTPAVLAGPVQLATTQTAMCFRWIEPGLSEAPGPFWKELAHQAATLSQAAPDGIAPLEMKLGASRTEILGVLGPEVGEGFVRRWEQAVSTVDHLIDNGPLALSHCDLHPGNALVDASGHVWLVDFEYCRLAPTEWDPAKIIILSRRFGDPEHTADLLSEWGSRVDGPRLEECIFAQEILIVGWLAVMAARGTAGAVHEARRRAASLDDVLTGAWRHLP